MAIRFAVTASVTHNSNITKAASIRSTRATRASALHDTEYQTDVRLGRIIRVLMNFSTTVVSGTKLAQEIGTSRSEVWRLVQQLRTFGVKIAGHPASGYQLTAVPDLLLPEMLQPLVRATIFGEHIHHYYRAGSTNTIALEASSTGDPEGSVFLAEQQTAGRGRGSNQWHSADPGGIYCSVTLRPMLPPSDVLVLSLAAGLAVRAAVQEIDPRVMPDLKWPNDLLIEGKKFCGILTEMSAEATRVRYIVVGIGINVNHESLPAELDATSLKLHGGREVSSEDLLIGLLRATDSFIAEDKETILRLFTHASSYAAGRRVTVALPDGSIEGTTAGLDPEGFLIVRKDDGTDTLILAGGVRALA